MQVIGLSALIHDFITKGVQTMLFISDLSGNEEPLLVSDVHITEQLNTVEQLDFSTINIPDNKSAFAMLQPRSIVTIPETGEQYRITENDGSAIGNYYQRNITGLQVLQDLDDKVISDTLTGSQSLQKAMEFITKGTKFTFTIHGQFENYDFGEDGIGNDHALGLFTDTLLTAYKFEFIAHGYQIDLYKEMGKHDSFVYLSGDDVYSLSDTGEYTQIRTHIVGTGKTTETDTSSEDDSSTTSTTVKAEYTSPNAKIYGIIDADPFSDESAENEEQLIKKMKESLTDYPQIQYTASVNKFERNNPDKVLNDSTIGNWGYLRDRNGLDVETRIIQRDVYPQSNQEDTLTFGNFILDPNKMLVTLKSNRDTDMKAIKELQSKDFGGSEIDKQFDVTKVGEVDD